MSKADVICNNFVLWFVMISIVYTFQSKGLFSEWFLIVKGTIQGWSERKQWFQLLFFRNNRLSFGNKNFAWKTSKGNLSERSQTPVKSFKSLQIWSVIQTTFQGLVYPQGPEEMCLSLEHQTPSKTSEKWVILIALQFRYTFYRPQTKRLRARKIGLQYKIRTCPFFYSALRASVALPSTAFGHPSGDVPCASDGYGLRLLIGVR